MANFDRPDLCDLERDQAFQVILDEARIRLELPQLLARILDRDRDAAHLAIRDWASGARPISDIADELRRALGEG